MDVIEKIIKFVEKRNDLLYVIQNGSRVNPSVSPDEYADYDIIVGCSNPKKYIDSNEWIDEFGDLLIIQKNECQENDVSWPIFLMQFKDGLRIDLQYYPGDGIKKYFEDSLSKIILDKNGIFKIQFEPSEKSYTVKKPNEEKYNREVNNFWWCLINVGKGLARKELTYSRFMYEAIVRNNFLNIVGWYAGINNNWEINCGKFGKFINRYIDIDIWEQIEKTYFTDTIEEFWESIVNAGNLIKMMDRKIRVVLNIEKPKEDYDQIIKYLMEIKIHEENKNRTTTAST